jgi:hypothetical protein
MLAAAWPSFPLPPSGANTGCTISALPPRARDVYGETSSTRPSSTCAEFHLLQRLRRPLPPAATPSRHQVPRGRRWWAMRRLVERRNRSTSRSRGRSWGPFRPSQVYVRNDVSKSGVARLIAQGARAEQCPRRFSRTSRRRCRLAGASGTARRTAHRPHTGVWSRVV